MNRVDIVDLVVDLVDVDLDVDLVDVDLDVDLVDVNLDDQKYDFCLARTDLNIVDGLNRNTCTTRPHSPSPIGCHSVCVSFSTIAQDTEC